MIPPSSSAWEVPSPCRTRSAEPRSDRGPQISRHRTAPSRRTRQERSGRGGDPVPRQPGSEPLGRIPRPHHRDGGIVLLGRLEQRAAIPETVRVELMGLQPPWEQERPASGVVRRTGIRGSLCARRSDDTDARCGLARLRGAPGPCFGLLFPRPIIENMFQPVLGQGAPSGQAPRSELRIRELQELVAPDEFGGPVRRRRRREGLFAAAGRVRHHEPAFKETCPAPQRRARPPGGAPSRDVVLSVIVSGRGLGRGTPSNAP